MFSRRTAFLVVACALLAAVGSPTTAQSGAAHGNLCPIWTVGDLLASPTPFAVAHRGFGENLTDPTRPLENTLDAFRHGFTDGMRIVELDLQRTSDGKIVVFHDDFLLPDLTCVSSLTYDQLRLREPQVPLFLTVLNAMRHFDRAEALSGIVFAEIKVPVPLCDGANTSELAAASEGPLVAAVLDVIRQSHMEGQVVLNSESPSILAQVQRQAPEIPRAPTLNALQLLPPDQIGPIVGYPAVLIPKNDLGLSWYEIGPIARLPAYPELADFIGTSLALQSTAVSMDKLVLLGAGAQAPGLVQQLHGFGLKVVAWTVDASGEWDAVVSDGVDGITTNNIAFALEHQAPLTSDFTCPAGARDLRLTAAGTTGIMASARLALAPSLPHPFVDGRLHVAFTLDNAAPARLAVYDVAGRSVEAREVGVLGAGRHELAMGDGLSPGVYFVRLTSGAQNALVKAVVAH